MRLLDQFADQVFRQHLDVPRHVVDVLLRVQHCELPPGFRQRLDDLRAHLAQARVKCREQAGRPGADNQRIEYFLLSHRFRFSPLR